MSFRIRQLKTVSSTNDEVKEALRGGEPEGLVVHALRQEGGYGRQGRVWTSPPGGLYLSLLLRPDVPIERLSTLSLVVGLAVREAIVASAAAAAAERVRVKWPNDVVFDGGGAQAKVAKLCGISLERVGGGICVGIGVNVRPPEGEAAMLGKNRPCYLVELGFDGSVEAVRDAVLAAFEPRYETWCAHGLSPFLGEYASCALLTGRTVIVEDREGAVLAEGHAQGIDAQGRLLVVDETTQRTVALASGEAHIASIATLF